MKTLLLRIKNRAVLTKKNFKSDCYFSLYYAILRVVGDVCGRLHMSQIAKWAQNSKDAWILNYLQESAKETLRKFHDNEEKGTYEDDAPIWVCWWSGEKDAPLLVKQCIKSIRKNAGLHPVIFIDKDTHSNYIDIPLYMMEKVESGRMGLAHLSDYIRISLIEKYGGLWLDATIFCSQEIPEDYFEIPFFTCKSHPTNCGYLSQLRWTTFVLGGWKGNVFYKCLKEIFESYWSKEEIAIDYLFFDFLIELARSEVPEVLKQMESVPVNNSHRDDLQGAMNKNLSSKCWNEVVTKENVLYKLSWREHYRVQTDNGQDSIYKFFLEYPL